MTSADPAVSNALPNAMQVELGERRVRFEVPESIHDLDTVMGAAYLFLDRCYVFLDRAGDARLQVVLRTREPADEEALLALAGEFSNELLNQALRKNIGEANAKIREFIMARALFASDGPSTIDKLLAELDAEEMADADLDIPVPWDKPASKTASKTATNPATGSSDPPAGTEGSGG